MNVKPMFIFAIGAAVGAGAVWIGLKKHYAAIVQEEIDSVKETYARLRNDIDCKIEKIDEVKSKEEMLNIINTHYARTENERIDYYSGYSTEGKKTGARAPYVISPEECGEEMGYDITELTYYVQDELLVDGFGEIIEDPEDTVGKDFADHFGEYEDDSVFIRNDRLKTDFEILKDLGNYEDNH